MTVQISGTPKFLKYTYYHDIFLYLYCVITLSTIPPLLPISKHCFTHPNSLNSLVTNIQLMSLSHYRQNVLLLEALLGSTTTSKVAPFRPSCSHYRQCNLQAIGIWRKTPVLQLPSKICKRPCVTVVKRPVPQLTLCRCSTPKRWPSHNLMYTVDHTFGYRSKKFIRACLESFRHCHGMQSEAEILNFW